jgi:hypothetical protein
MASKYVTASKLMFKADFIVTSDSLTSSWPFHTLFDPHQVSIQEIVCFFDQMSVGLKMEQDFVMSSISALASVVPHSN